MRRRKPDSMEVQQMKTQAKEEKTRFLLLLYYFIYINNFNTLNFLKIY